MIGFSAGRVLHSIVSKRNTATFASCCPLKTNSWCRYQTISPSSFVQRIQGTPKSVMINFCAGIVRHSLVCEWNAVTMARSCFLKTSSWRRVQAISPSSFIHRIQGTPRSVMTSVGAGIISYSSVLKRNATTLTRCCFMGTRGRDQAISPSPFVHRI